MLLKSTFAEPVLATHPRTGMVINVAPLFDAIEQFGGDTDSLQALIDAIDESILIINLTVHDPAKVSPRQLADHNFDLFRLREMLERIEVRQQD